MLRVVCLCVLATLMAGVAQAQNKMIKDGAWSLVSVTADLANGSKSEPFGADPKGIIIFTPDGHFALFQSRAKLPKIASNDRAKATAEEAAAIVAGSIAYFGTYSVDEGERSLSVTLDGSTFPNILAGSVQKRLITSLDTNELKFANPRTPSGMTLQTVWKRAEVR